MDNLTVGEVNKLMEAINDAVKSDVVKVYSSYTPAQKKATLKYRELNRDKINAQRKEYYKKKVTEDPKFLEYKRTKAKEYYERKKLSKDSLPKSITPPLIEPVEPVKVEEVKPEVVPEPTPEPAPEPSKKKKVKKVSVDIKEEVPVVEVVPVSEPVKKSKVKKI